MLFVLAFVALLGSGFMTKQKADKQKIEKQKVAYIFQLQDQNGKLHDLSQYEGKTVFINFWATWCPNCMQEMPDIQALYHEYGENQKDVIILTVANPSSKEYPRNSDIELDQLKAFIQKKKYDFPVLMDTTGDVFDHYQIQAFPTTYMITKKGDVRGFLMGEISKKDMKTIIENTKSGK